MFAFYFIDRGDQYATFKAMNAKNILWSVGMI